MSVSLKTIGIISKNMKETLDFYRTLGFAIPKEADKEENYDFENSGIIMGFLTEKLAQQSDPNYQNSTGNSINLQFLCNSSEEVNKIYKKLIAAGYKSYSEPWDTFWGQRFARIIDPDERIVNIYAYINK